MSGAPAYRAKSRTRVDQRGRSTNEFADARMREGARPPDGTPWIWITRELLESAAWHGLSLSARRALDRLIREHMAHGGKENGLLVVTHDDFAVAGVRKASVTEALDELVASELVIVTYRDTRRGVRRRPSMYALAWLPWWRPSWTEDGEPTHEIQQRREKWPEWTPSKKQNATPQNGGDNPSETEVITRSITPQNGGDGGSNIPSEMEVLSISWVEDGQRSAGLLSDDDLGEAAA